MEIKVYSNFDAKITGKSVLCVRVVSPDVFDFHKTVDVFRCLYGSDIVIEILVV